jgi:hypothetical protein
MEFLKKFDLTGVQFLKLLALVFGALVVLVLLINIFSNSARLGMNEMGLSMPPTSSMGGESALDYDKATLSARNVVQSEPQMDGGYTAGDESESFEVKEYTAQIETRTLVQDCDIVRALKARTDVVFENANEHDRGCTYTFKVKKESVVEVLGILESLNPRELVENSYTIKREVDDYTSEIQILQNKLATLDATLAEATASYSNITELATRTGNVESLARIIESKLMILERLTNARIDAGNQLERITRAKAEALDRLEYTYFYVTMIENTFVNKEVLKDSWMRAVQQSVYEMNTLVQDLSIGLVALLLTVIKFALYFGIILIVTRFGWSFAKKVWKVE